MIRLEGLSKFYMTRHGRRVILDNVNLQIDKGERLGVLGRNGAGKSTLIRVISGAERPSQGKVTRTMSVSWPLAFGGAFQTALTGMDNLKFICRVYGIDPESRIGFVEDFAELGTYFREPVKTYSSGMRARLAFAISLSIDFDCFMIDEIVAVGDSRFTAKCLSELFDKRKDRAMVIVSHDAAMIGRYCNRATLLANGQLLHFNAVDDAQAAYLAG